MVLVRRDVDLEERDVVVGVRGRQQLLVPSVEINPIEMAEIGIAAFLAALTMGVLRNGLNLLGVSSFLQQLVIGVVIIAAVLVDLAMKEKRA